MAERTGDWEPVPSFRELLNCAYDFFSTSAEEFWHYKNSNSTLHHEKLWQNVGSFRNDIALLACLAVTLTVTRCILTEWCFKPIGQYYKLTPGNCKKMPESAWKFLYRLCAWSLAFYIAVLSGKYRFFQNPSTMWAGWNLSEPLPSDIYWMYMIQLSFQVHSLYAAIFLDTWRKDSIAMMIHDALAISVTALSYTFRCHNIGLFAFLLLDIGDVLLEFAKLNAYFKVQGRKRIYRHKVLADVTFVVFLVTWFSLRMYYFPLKLLYTATCGIARFQLDVPYFAAMNAILWMLQLINCFWTVLILKVLIRVLTGETEELEDVREYDEDNLRAEPTERQTEIKPAALHRNAESKETAVIDGGEHEAKLRSRRNPPR